MKEKKWRIEKMNNMNVIVENKPGEIKLNFDEMKEVLKGRLEEYKDAVFTEDTKKYAKGTVAELRKEQKAFKSRITEVKTEYMKPFELFKVKADELVQLYDEPIDGISEQITAFEEARKEEKRLLIHDLYTEIAKIGRASCRERV